eukprot:TRINITY_DN5548_c0_g1_i1.p1 TRINITY_DN5548_c0_g1~~TRINITY_DN5548_c0_g1_i1.p1  ORF type:complete len:507 (+),score=150.81 TRINITY_DN5548_c0_g1_i1:71-1591(+)
MTTTRPRSASTLVAIGDYHLEDALNGDGGTGASGLIRLALNKKDKTRVVVKELQLTSPRTNMTIRREITVMQALRHKHTVSLLNSFEADNRMFIVMRYAENGDLFSKITQTPKGRLNNKEAKRWFAQIVNGVDYMHSEGFVHLDVKPDNIFVTRNDDILLGDFGRSCTFERGRATVRASPGTLQYAPPEAMYERAVKRWSDARELFDRIGVKCSGSYPVVEGPGLDLWALGSTLYVMLTGCFPFGGHSSTEVIEQVLLATPKYPFYITHDCLIVLKGLLEKNPAKRWDMQQLKQSAWLRDEMRELDEARTRALEAQAQARSTLQVPQDRSGSMQAADDGSVNLVMCSPRGGGDDGPMVINVSTPRGGTRPRSPNGARRTSCVDTEARRGSMQEAITAGDISPRQAIAVIEEEDTRVAVHTESTRKPVPGRPSPFTDTMEDLILDDAEMSSSSDEDSPCPSSTSSHRMNVEDAAESAFTSAPPRPRRRSRGKLTSFQKRVRTFFMRQ